MKVTQREMAIYEVFNQLPLPWLEPGAPSVLLGKSLGVQMCVSKARQTRFCKTEPSPRPTHLCLWRNTAAWVGLFHSASQADLQPRWFASYCILVTTTADSISSLQLASLEGKPWLFWNQGKFCHWLPWHQGFILGFSLTLLAYSCLHWFQLEDHH